MVHFVGAGPGAPDLITLRGARLLEQADWVIYAGSLVSPQVLTLCREETRLVNSAEMTLEQVVQLCATAREEGREVVRLHTGDPSLYGAVREQMNALDALGIPWDMTPGVSSFSAAAAALGAEYTLPGVSQSLIITRLSGRTPSTESLRALAVHGCSMVIFLSAGLVDRVQEELLSGGYREDTPAAVVYKASWPEERILRCPLCQLAGRTREAGITRTALIAVGDFLSGAGERSCLYHPDFTTGYRKGGRA